VGKKRFGFGPQERGGEKENRRPSTKTKLREKRYRGGNPEAQKTRKLGVYGGVLGFVGLVCGRG